VNSYSQIRHSHGYYRDTIAIIIGFSRIVTCALLILWAVGVYGCTNIEITAAQRELANGNYAAAHERFVAASHSTTLTTREWRVLADGLCVTETKLGPPQYSLREQRLICANAATRAGSSSGPALARIDSAERAATQAEVDGALKANDVAAAQTAVVRYQSFPGADQNAIALWSRQIWSTLEQQEARSKNHDRRLLPAIAAVSHRYPGMRAMNDAAFRHWVMANATVERTPLVDGIDLQKRALDLRVTSESLPDVALNLDRFTRINDAMAARCRCDGRTNIAVEGSGLPAYLLRLDPETRRSEVLVMPQPH
jgi:hypothetical protein